MPLNSKYDVTIIGAGIGGLICANYLAKSGFKVMVFERNSNPGGYCCFFRRGPYKFDAGVHYLGSLRENGQLNRIFTELDLYKTIEIKRFKTADILLDNTTSVKLSVNLNETIKSFIKAFPEENPREIEKFFKYMHDVNIIRLVMGYKKITSFETFLDSFFKKVRIKNFLRTLLANIGSVEQVNAVSAIVLFKEFILDGGYYPLRGFGEMSYALTERLKAAGGEITFNSEVRKILVDNRKKAIGVELKDGQRFRSRIVISNADLTHLSKNLLPRAASIPIRKKASRSVFVVYLGLRKLPNKIARLGMFGGLWFIPEMKKSFTDRMLDITANDAVNGPFFITIPTLIDNTLAPENHHIMRIQIVSSFKSKAYWQKNKMRISNILIKRAEKVLGPIRENAEKIHNATPYDFYRYTYNLKGAMVGWAPDVKNYRKKIDLKLQNFFQIGHWGILPGGQGGVSMAAATGRLIAQRIK